MHNTAKLKVRYRWQCQYQRTARTNWIE